MKRVIILVTFILAFLCLKTPVFASENNKFGIHISNPSNIDKAAELVNSNGGDWGYITIVVQENDRNHNKWQDFFNACREKHLIPLVRLAAEPVEEIWKVPTMDSLTSWADFLGALNWPIKNRYIIIFNEPNQTKEWGGQTNPKEYAQILNQAIDIFKAKNPDFFILNAGFDQAASNSTTTMDEYKFLQDMNFEIPGIFNRLDAWVSHSYPNHGYIGKPWETGKASVKGYEWELALLKNNFNLNKDLPVFITETGWPHTENQKSKVKSQNYYKPEISAGYIQQAFKNVWLPDQRVIAVTPFILNYPQPPFSNFSWIDSVDNPYPQFDAIKQLTKVSGQPEQIQKIEIVSISFPSFVPANNTFIGKITLKNIGQSIWGEKLFSLTPLTRLTLLTPLTLPNETLIKPGEKHSFEFKFSTLSNAGEYLLSWQGLPEYKVTVFEAWKLTNTSQTFFNRLVNKITNLWYGFIR